MFLGFGLSDFLANPLPQITDAVPLVGFRGFDGPKFCGNGTDLLPIDSPDGNQGLFLNLCANTFGKRKRNGMGKSQAQFKRRSLHVGSKADSDDLQLLLESSGHARHHVGDKAAREPLKGS